jgi:hypothetical protein
LLIRRYKVSEERNRTQEEEASTLASLEAQVRARANELLAQRARDLKAEVERLQANISEISSRLTEQETFIIEQDASGLIEYVRQWLNDSIAKAEEDFKSRLEQARAEIAASAREEAEKDFQRRLEQACAEASAVARREAEAQIQDLREQLEASRKALTLAVSSPQQTSSQAANFDTIKTAIESIDSQRSQSEALSALVRHAAQFAPRVVFFVIKSGEAIGWKATGFENGLNDETAKLLKVSSQKQSILRDAMASFRLAASNTQTGGLGSNISAVLGLYSSPLPERAVAIPLIVRNKVAAVLYADSGTRSEDSINTAALESLMRIAAMTIELLPSRRGVPGVSQAPLKAPVTTDQPAPQSQPSVHAEAISAEPEVRKEAEPQVKPDSSDWRAGQEEEIAHGAANEITEEKRRTTEELAPTPDTITPAVQSLHQAEAQSPEPARAEATPEVSPATSRRVTKEVTETAAEIFRATPQFKPPTTPAAPEPQATLNENLTSAPTMPMSDFVAQPTEERAPRPGTPIFQPPSAPVFTQPNEAPRPAQPLAPTPIQGVPTPGSETEQRAHNDARRFARLLVSEIKLYNAAKVNDGRRNYDLYDRLKDEIDRSRKVYDKRVAPAVAGRFDYFYDELVQTLAEGDPAKLGKNCPGPVVLA